MPALNFPSAPWAWAYAEVEQSLYNWLFIGKYNSVAYQAIGTRV